MGNLKQVESILDYESKQALGAEMGLANTAASIDLADLIVLVDLTALADLVHLTARSLHKHAILIARCTAAI